MEGTSGCCFLVGFFDSSEGQHKFTLYVSSYILTYTLFDGKVKIWKYGNVSDYIHRTKYGMAE